jgi:hypothetical protein
MEIAVLVKVERRHVAFRTADGGKRLYAGEVEKKNMQLLLISQPKTTAA